KIADRARSDGAAAGALATQRSRNETWTPRPARAESVRARARGAGLAHGDDLPGADDIAQSGLHDRPPAGRDDVVAPRLHGGSGQRSRGASARARGHYRRGAAPRAVPAPALRRSASARDDRDG